MRKIYWTWYVFKDGYRECVRGQMLTRELKRTEAEHGKLTSSWKQVE